MYKVGEKVLYKNEVCSVEEIKKNTLSKDPFYILVPIFSNGCQTKIQVPASNIAGNIRDLLTRDEVDELVKAIPSIPLCDSKDTMIKKEYEILLKSYKVEDLVCIIKTTYLKNKDRALNNKKLSSVDDAYFHEAERILYSQLAVVLEKTIDETRKYVIKQLGIEN
ncbi:hypothetical protein [Anaerorhabdus sp.]|uniref:hypothetical protein n=1 Tax=Anaerorhabdus sp. TaxID=1872524 RepID=UPI002FC76253